jgi:hypothetical protein
MFAISMGGIANDWVRQVFEVAAQLVTATTKGLGLYQTIAAGGVTPHRDRQLDGGQAAIIGAGRPGLDGWSLGGSLIWFVAQRIVNGALLGAITAQYRQILFAHLTAGKDFGRPASRLRREAKEQNPRGRFIETMYRIDALAKLITQQLQQKPSFPSIDRTAMYEQTGGLVDRHQVLIKVKNL